MLVVRHGHIGIRLKHWMVSLPKEETISKYLNRCFIFRWLILLEGHKNQLEIYSIKIQQDMESYADPGAVYTRVETSPPNPWREEVLIQYKTN